MGKDNSLNRDLRIEKTEEDTRRSMQQSLHEGQVEVWLEGKKLRGGYALVRTGRGNDTRWLLIKMRDDEADARRNPRSTEPESVLSGKTLEEIVEEDSSS
jgi:hypothetical protein